MLPVPSAQCPRLPSVAPHAAPLRAVLKDVTAAMFFGPREKFSQEEFTALKEFLDQGGSVRRAGRAGGQHLPVAWTSAGKAFMSVLCACGLQGFLLRLRAPRAEREWPVLVSTVSQV